MTLSDVAGSVATKTSGGNALTMGGTTGADVVPVTRGLLLDTLIATVTNAVLTRRACRSSRSWSSPPDPDGPGGTVTRTVGRASVSIDALHSPGTAATIGRLVASGRPGRERHHRGAPAALDPGLGCPEAT